MEASRACPGQFDFALQMNKAVVSPPPPFLFSNCNNEKIEERVSSLIVASKVCSGAGFGVEKFYPMRKTSTFSTCILTIVPTAIILQGAVGILWVAT